MKGFERFDKGHKSYIGFLYLEHTLNNAVLKLFAELLLEGCRKRRLEEGKALRDDKATPLAVAQLEDWIDISAKGMFRGRRGLNLLWQTSISSKYVAKHINKFVYAPDCIFQPIDH